MSWAQNEFKTLELGDQRLNARAVLLAERLTSKPTESIPNACLGWAETQAAYRFLSNPRTDWQALLEPHWASSLERMRGHKVVLNIQDTPELDFNGRQSAGLGPLSYEAQRGMYLHPTYATALSVNRWVYWTLGCGRESPRTAGASKWDSPMTRCVFTTPWPTTSPRSKSWLTRP